MKQEAARREAEMIARIQKDQEDNMSEMDKAKDLLKMKTVKIQRAAPAEVSSMPLYPIALQQFATLLPLNHSNIIILKCEPLPPDHLLS